MLRHRLTMQQLEALVMRYGVGWGSSDETIRLVGILEGKEVVERSFGADAAAKKLVAEADSSHLTAVEEEEWSSTRVVVRAVDQYDNTLPFVFEPYAVEVEGPARLIGPSQRALVGGASAFWVAGGREKGHVRIAVSSPRFEAPAILELEVE
jgi:beta-galactosidase